MQFEDHLDADIHNNFVPNAPFNKAEGAKEKWINAGWWAKFIAISIGVFLVLGCLFFVNISISGLSRFGNTRMPIIGWILALGLLGFWSRELWIFGNDVRAGIKRNDMATFNKGLGHLKNYFLILVISLVLSMIYQFYSLVQNPQAQNQRLQEILESQQ